MDQFMKRAVQIAAKNVREGGESVGAVLVKDGKVVTKGINELHQKYDVRGYAEFVAIQKAPEQIPTHDRSGYTMYASAEPWAMTSMYYAGIRDADDGVLVKETVDVGLTTSEVLYCDVKESTEAQIISMQHMPFEAEQENPMKLWKERNQNG